MGILEWVHRRLSPKHAVLRGAKDSSHEAQECKEEDARREILTLQVSNWQHGLLAIGTFGVDGKEAVAHVLKVIQADEHLTFQKDELVSVIVGRTIDIHSAIPNALEDDKAGGCRLICNEDNNEDRNAEYEIGVKIHNNLQEVLTEVAPLGYSIKKKSDTAKVFENCLSGNNKWACDKLIDVKICGTESKEKGDESTAKHACSLLKMILKWKITGSRSSKVGYGGKCGADPQCKLTKTFMQLIRAAMFNKKIQPENVAAALRGIRSGCFGAPKTFVGNTANGLKLKKTVDRYEYDQFGTSIGDLLSKSSENNERIKQYDIDGVVEEEAGSSDSETLSHSRDNSSGSREYWVKTDSEYVVLEL